MPARHGDALILHCSKNGNRGIIAIDGGPYPNPRFNPFIKEIEKHLPIDLMVATHFDDDHLVGIKRFIENHRNDNPFPVKRIWANCAKHISFDLSEDLSSKKASRMVIIVCLFIYISQLEEAKLHIAFQITFIETQKNDAEIQHIEN